MPENTTIASLTSGVASKQPKVDMRPSEIPVAPETASASIEVVRQERERLQHALSEPVTIAIVLGVMVVIIGVILGISYLIGRLRKKSSLDIQPPIVKVTDEPLSSGEPRHSEG